MADDNRPLKYMRYAVGEIVLVVIGILIALQINTWNEQRKDKERTRHLLESVQKELLHNIERCNFVADFYRDRDSIYYKVVNKKATYGDYIRNRSYQMLVIIYEPVLLVDDAFTNLIETDGQLSQEQDSIVLKLKGLYGTKKQRTDEKDLKVGLAVDDYLEKLNIEKEWYFDYMHSKVTDEIIEYHLSDPFYFNQVAHYGDKALIDHTVSISEFKNEATNIYEELSDYLDLKKDTSVVKNMNDYKHYLGVYEVDSLHNMNVVVENNKMMFYYIAKNDTIILESHRVFPDSKKYFTIYHLFGELMFDENGEVTKMVYSNIGDRFEHKKID